ARVPRTSAAPLMAAASAPATKPICTATVSSPSWAGDSPQSRASAGATAAALNQVLIPPTWARAMKASARQHPAGSAAGGAPFPGAAAVLTGPPRQGRERGQPGAAPPTGSVAPRAAG